MDQSWRWDGVGQELKNTTLYPATTCNYKIISPFDTLFFICARISYSRREHSFLSADYGVIALLELRWKIPFLPICEEPVS